MRMIGPPDPRGWAWWSGPEPGQQPLPLPPEFVIRDLLAANLDDPAEIREFVAVNGWLFGEDDFRLTTNQSASLPSCGFWVSGEDRTRTLLQGPTRDQASLAEQPDRQHPRTWPMHVLEQRYQLKVTRALVGHWLNDQAGRPVEDAWMEELGLIPDQPWVTFCRELTNGLAPFRVRVELKGGFPGAHESRVGLGPGLYEAMCLQLFNLIAEGLPPRQCANETCQRFFFRQIGRAEHGQYRTEGVVRYCSPSCANTQSQRDYRRRKRAEKGDAR